VESSKVVRRDALCKPDAVCMRCFNSQQQLRFPFLVYCAHRETLALIHSAHESTTFQCAPAQLHGLLAHLDRQRAGVQAHNATSSSAGGEAALR
jgi:hypothetical protein